MKTSRLGPRAVMASVGLSHVKTSGREKDHETNKFLANCHRRTRSGRTRTKEERDRLGIKSGKTTLATGAKTDEARALEVLS